MANTGQYDSQTNIETEDYEREIFVRPEAAVIYGGSVVNSVNGQVGDVILTTSDLENTSDYQTGAQVQNAIAGKQDKLTAGSGLNLDGTTLSVDTNIIATVQDVTDEATIRENSDANLQGQIDALTVSSDVIDVLGTYQDLQNYDTSHVKANDIIKVLQDSTHNNSMSYYRWEITDNVGSWVYVGSEGPYYTKSEADALLDSKQNVIADLPQIRSGAEAGATAVQPEDLSRIATTGSYNDSLDKPSINNVTLIGNISLDALGIQPKGNYALKSEIPDVMPAHDVVVTGSFSVNSYKLTYQVDGADYKTLNVNYGVALTPEQAPAKEGYTFSGWSEIPATMPAHDVVITGTFRINSYKLTYLVDGETYKTIDVTYGTTLLPEQAPEKEGYTFLGWSEIPATMPANDVVITGTFSINSYKVTFMYGDIVLKTITVEYGAAIPLPTSLDSERYTLVEWLEVPTTMPAHDVTIRANYVDGISMVQNDGKSARRIQLNGISSNTLMKGIHIIRMSDGSTKKVMVK